MTESGSPDKSFPNFETVKEESLQYYRDENINLIPLKYGDKRPVGEWKKYQSQRMTKEEKEQYFSDGAWYNVGVVCGAISDNLFVIDCDSEEVFRQLFSETAGLVIVKTSRGYHVYFKANQPVKTLKIRDDEDREVVTLKGEGSYVVAPPSKHASGSNYTFVQRGPIPRLRCDQRQELRERAEKIGLHVPKEKIPIEESLTGVPEGNRDNCLMGLIHFLRRSGATEEKALKICEVWNKRNKPPLEDVSYKVEYHYGLAEPYHYLYSHDPARWTITEEVKLKEKTKRKRDGKERSETKREYSEEIKQKARELIKDPAFFAKFGNALEKGMFLPDVGKVRYVLGEEDTKRHLGVHIATARLKRHTINFIFGNYATVKDTMVKMLFHLIGARYARRGYLTAAGMRYSKEIEDTDILYLPEADLGGEKGRQMRFMRSDDGGFEFEYAHKNKETGLMETETEKVGIKTIIITTNCTTFDGALSSGGWLFQTDDSKELTARVVPAKLEDYVNPREILTDEDIRTWNCAFDILTKNSDIPNFIRIKFAPKLIELFDLNRSETRRSPDKICELIQDIAILRRYQKPPEKRNEADFIDLFTALRIGRAAITETVSELTTKEQAVYDTVKEIEGQNKLDFLDSDKEGRNIPDGATAKQISMKLPYSTDTCYRLAENITDKGYFAKGKHGRENVYTIKTEINDSRKNGKSRIPILKEAKEVLKLCVEFAIPKNELGNSENGIVDQKIVDPITSHELSIWFFPESDEIKIDEIDPSEKDKTKNNSIKVGIRDNPTIDENEERTKHREPELQNLILDYVQRFTAGDERGAFIRALSIRIASDERDYIKTDVEELIKHLVEEGILTKHTYNGGDYVKLADPEQGNTVTVNRRITDNECNEITEG